MVLMAWVGRVLGWEFSVSDDEASVFGFSCNRPPIRKVCDVSLLACANLLRLAHLAQPPSDEIKAHPNLEITMLILLLVSAS